MGAHCDINHSESKTIHAKLCQIISRETQADTLGQQLVPFNHLHRHVQSRAPGRPFLLISPLPSSSLLLFLLSSFLSAFFSPPFPLAAFSAGTVVFYEEKGFQNFGKKKKGKKPPKKNTRTTFIQLSGIFLCVNPNQRLMLRDIKTNTKLLKKYF